MLEVAEVLVVVEGVANDKPFSRVKLNFKKYNMKKNLLVRDLEPHVVWVESVAERSALAQEARDAHALGVEGAEGRQEFLK